MASKENYFVATKATFTPLPASVCARFARAYAEGSGYMEYNGRIWRLDFVSNSLDDYFGRGCFSAYWICGEYLIRVSDHWSSGSEVVNCGNIRKCWWRLSTHRHRTGGVHAHRHCAGVDTRLQAGIVKMSAMRPR